MDTLTIEGIKVQPSIEALGEGGGFIVRLNVSWNLDREFRDAMRQAQSEGVIGSRLNSHEATYDEAKAALATALDDFETEINTFIQTYNISQE